MQYRTMIVGVFLSLFVLAGCTQQAPVKGPVVDEVPEPAAVEVTPNTVAPTLDAERPEGVTTFTVDTEASRVEWRAERVLRDSKHKGTVPLEAGEIWHKEDAFMGGLFVLSMAGLMDEDIENVAMRTKLETHIKSADFFDVEMYPQAWLQVTAVAGDEDAVDVTADLTIKGITKEITFPATIEAATPEDGPKTLTITAEITIDRADWDVRYGSETFFDNLGDSVIADEIDYTITLVAVQQ